MKSWPTQWTQNIGDEKAWHRAWNTEAVGDFRYERSKVLLFPNLMQNRLIRWLTWLFDRLLIWWMHWLIDWLPCCSMGCLLNRLMDWLLILIHSFAHSLTSSYLIFLDSRWKTQSQLSFSTWSSLLWIHLGPMSFRHMNLIALRNSWQIENI